MFNREHLRRLRGTKVFTRFAIVHHLRFLPTRGCDDFDEVRDGSLAPSEQFGAWHDWYRPLFDTAARNPPEEGFRAKCSIWLLGALTITQASAPAIWTARTRALIRRNPIDHWVITVGKRGTVELTTGNTCVSPGVGVPYVISLADEMEATKSDYSRLQFYLGRDGFHEIDPLLEASRAKALDTPGGRLLADYMTLLARRLPDLTVEEGAQLAKAVEAMVAACLGPSADRLALASKQLCLTLMERVRRSVRVNLRSPSLGPHELCREAAISRTQLYRILEGEGGVAHYIHRQRLSEGFAQLSDISNVPAGFQNCRNALLRRCLELQPRVSTRIRHQFEQRSRRLACRTAGAVREERGAGRY